MQQLSPKDETLIFQIKTPHLTQNTLQNISQTSTSTENSENIQQINQKLQISPTTFKITSESSFPLQSPTLPPSKRNCPYISTIKRQFLDFDFEKLCSVSLLNLNVYACLVCGKYYQGRGKSTYAYTHSLETDHHIFINLQNTKVYCLPDNYEVLDVSLKDIQFNLSPYYQKEDLIEIDEKPKYRRALIGKEYLTGYVGLNNLKCTDYVNVIIQALTRVKPFRNYLIFFEKNYQINDYDFQTIVLKTFSQLMRKIWNYQNFKGHVSPHQFLQAISLKSYKQFQIQQQGDSNVLLSWLLDCIQTQIKGIPNSINIIDECFRGEVEIHTYKALRNQIGFQSVPIQESRPFTFLTLTMPNASLYVEDINKLSIPHVSIVNLLKKFDGVTPQDDSSSRQTFRIKKLPQFLIIVMKRFNSNNFFIEKNPTIVSFPMKDLDMKTYLDVSAISQTTKTKYNLIANISHQGKYKDGIYKIHVQNEQLNQFLEIQDLHITPIMPQLVCLSQAYIQIYELIT